MIFEIDGISYADHILSETYSINQIKNVSEWEDANGTKHKQLISKKISGSVDMFFRTIDEFNAFITHLNEHITQELTNRMIVSVNNTATDEEIEAFIECEPVRARDDFWRDYMLVYTLEIEER